MRLIVALFFLVGSALCGQDKGDTDRQVVVPNSNLMRCSMAQLWSEDKVQTGRVYPVQPILDRFDKNGCPQGVVALYDKTVSVDEIKASLDQRYGRWAMSHYETSAVKLWRVEPEKFSIQLATIGDSPKNMTAVGEKGMKQVIYLSFPQSQSSK
jgi:hypothetical protein